MAGVGACFYLIIFKDDIALGGLLTTGDLIASTVGLGVVLISTYRALGLPLLIIASVF